MTDEENTPDTGDLVNPSAYDPLPPMRDLGDVDYVEPAAVAIPAPDQVDHVHPDVSRETS